MIVLKENERLYATSWQYNSARILTRLAQLITAQGGKVKPLYPAVVSDRNLEEACTATQRRIESSSTFHLKVREPLISNLQKELALFQSIPNAPITVTHTSYINFTMNGVYYSYSLDNNPFFPFHYLKTPIDPKDVYEVVYNYGYGDGLEVLTQCSTMREAKADRKAYIENEHICPMIRKRRYPIHNNTVC